SVAEVNDAERGGAGENGFGAGGELELAEAEELVAVRLAVDAPLIVEAALAGFFVDHRHQQVLLDDVWIFVARHVDIRDEALYAVFAFEAFGQMTEKEILAEEDFAFRGEDVALVEAEIVEVTLWLFGVDGGGSVEDAGRRQEAGSHADEEVAGVAADVVVFAGDEVADEIRHHVFGDVIEQAHRSVPVILITLVPPGVEVVGFRLPRVHVVAERIEVVEFLVVETGALEGAIEGADHEVGRAVNGGVHGDEVAIGVVEVAEAFAVDAVAGVG